MAAIRRKHIVALDLPSAQLFLEDIHDILTLFQEALNKHGKAQDTDDTTVLFEVDDHECDTIEDLEAIGRHTPRTSKFNLRVSGHRGDSVWFIFVRFTISEYGSHWNSFGLSEDGEVLVYAKLRDILGRAKISGKTSIVELRHKYSPKAPQPEKEEQREEQIEAQKIVVAQKPEPWKKRLRWIIITAVITTIVGFILVRLFGGGG